MGLSFGRERRRSPFADDEEAVEDAHSVALQEFTFDKREEQLRLVMELDSRLKTARKYTEKTLQEFIDRAQFLADTPDPNGAEKIMTMLLRAHHMALAQEQIFTALHSAASILQQTSDGVHAVANAVETMRRAMDSMQYARELLEGFARYQYRLKDVLEQLSKAPVAVGLSMQPTAALSAPVLDPTEEDRRAIRETFSARRGGSSSSPSSALPHHGRSPLSVPTLDAAM